MQHGIVKATTTEERRRAAPAVQHFHLRLPLPVPNPNVNAAPIPHAITPSCFFLSSLQSHNPRVHFVSIYEIDCARIYLRIRYPKYVLLMKEAYGDEAEVHFRVFSCYQVSQASYVTRFLLVSPHRL